MLYRGRWLLRPAGSAALRASRSGGQRRSLGGVGGGGGGGGVPAPRRSDAEIAALLSTFPGAHSPRLADGSRAKNLRQHVNPLQANFQTPISVEAGWLGRAFARPALPLHLDLGCAGGRWAAELALCHPDMNVVGMEIRRVLPEAAERWAREHEIPNLHFLYGNSNHDVDVLMRAATDSSSAVAAAPPAPAPPLLPPPPPPPPPPPLVHSVSINFPDPWFKKKHHKRRVVRPSLLRALQACMVPGARLTFQSDVLAVSEDMVRQMAVTELGSEHFEVAPLTAGRALRRANSGGGGGGDDGDEFVVPADFWAHWTECCVGGGGADGDGAVDDWRPRPDWPFAGIVTEREKSVRRRGLEIYRALYLRRGADDDDGGGGAVRAGLALGAGEGAASAPSGRGDEEEA